MCKQTCTAETECTKLMNGALLSFLLTCRGKDRYRPGLYHRPDQACPDLPLSASDAGEVIDQFLRRRGWQIPVEHVKSPSLPAIWRCSCGVAAGTTAVLHNFTGNVAPRWRFFHILSFSLSFPLSFPFHYPFLSLSFPFPFPFPFSFPFPFLSFPFSFPFLFVLFLFPFLFLSVSFSLRLLCKFQTTVQDTVNYLTFPRVVKNT